MSTESVPEDLDALRVEIARRSYLTRPRTLVGRIEPMVREAIVASCSKRLALTFSEAQGLSLLDEVLIYGAKAVITTRDEAADLCGYAPAEILIIGISSTSYDILMCKGNVISHEDNPSPDDLPDLIQSHLDDAAN